MKNIYLYLIFLSPQNTSNEIIKKMTMFYENNKKITIIGVLSILTIISYFTFKQNDNKKQRNLTKNNSWNLGNSKEYKIVKHDWEKYKVFFEFTTTHKSFKDFFKYFAENTKESEVLLEHIKSLFNTYKNNNSELFISKNPHTNKFCLMTNISEEKLNKKPEKPKNILELINKKDKTTENINVYYENDDFYIIKSLLLNDKSRLDYLLIPKNKIYDNHMDFFTLINNKTFQNFFKALLWICETLNLDEHFINDNFKDPIKFIHFFTASANINNMFYFCIRDYNNYFKDNKKDLKVLDKYSHIKLVE
jgi:hypothetical protein